MAWGEVLGPDLNGSELVMARRYERRFSYLADRREMCGEVNRTATLSEGERSFRFSEIGDDAGPAAWGRCGTHLYEQAGLLVPRERTVINTPEGPAPTINTARTHWLSVHDSKEHPND